MDDRAAILAVNDAFYRAFTRRDLAAMRAVWTGTADDCCIHPGWEIKRGWRDILQTWREIFASSISMRFALSEVAVSVLGDVALVVLVEEIQTPQGESIGRVAATKVFRRTPDGWRLSLHHGSPIAPADEDEPELDEGPLN